MSYFTSISTFKLPELSPSTMSVAGPIAYTAASLTTAAAIYAISNINIPKSVQPFVYGTGATALTEIAIHGLESAGAPSLPYKHIVSLALGTAATVATYFSQEAKQEPESQFVDDTLVRKSGKNRSECDDSNDENKGIRRNEDPSISANRTNTKLDSNAPKGSESASSDNECKPTPIVRQLDATSEDPEQKTMWSSFKSGCASLLSSIKNLCWAPIAWILSWFYPSE